MRPGSRPPVRPGRGDDGMTWEPARLQQARLAGDDDALPGGHDNFAPDRALAGRLLQIYPALPNAARREQGVHRPRRHLGSPGREPPVRRPRHRPACTPLRRGPRPHPVTPSPSGSSTSTTTPLSPRTCGRCW